MTEADMIDAVLAHHVDQSAAVNQRSVDEEIATGRWATDEWFGRRNQSDRQVKGKYENGKKVLADYKILTDQLVYVDDELRRWEGGKFVRFDVNRPVGKQIVIGYNKCTMRYLLASFVLQPRLHG